MNTISPDIFCDFVQTGPNSYECNNCGLSIMVVEGSEPPMFPCSRAFKKEEGEDPPSFAQKIKNFGKALVDHVGNGLPQCTEEQILKRYAICESCEFLQNSACSKCGCPVFRNKRFASKLAWADQECPVGKWGKEV